MGRHKKRVLWFALAMALLTALWVLNVEITYRRNVRHIPTDFRVRHRHAVELWKV